MLLHSMQSRLINQLLAARLGSVTLGDARTLLGSSDLSAGYALQAELTGAAPIAGWKVGATSAATQARLGMPEPFLGSLLASKIHRGESIRVSAREMIIRGIEAEICFTIKEDVPVPKSKAEYFTAESIAPFVSHLTPAIEICATRFVPAPAEAALLIADFGGNGSVLISEKLLRPFSVELHGPAWSVNVTCTEKAAKQPIKGSTKDVLGHPLNSLAWIANAMGTHYYEHNRKDYCLKRGQVVISGATCGLIPIPPNKSCSYSVKFDGIGELEFAYDA